MAATKTWASSGSTSWTTAGNWSAAAVPVAADTAVINLGTLGPNIIATGATASAVEVGTSATGGLLTISAGGGLSDANGYLGFNAGASGTASITGTGSKWANTTALFVGYNGTGTFSILSGGTATSVASTIGSAATSRGTATVDGTTSKWTNTGALTVGSAGTGALTVSNGGVVTNTSGVIGTTATTGNGSVTVTGSGSSWTNSAGLTVGSAGTGSLSVSNGGTVSNTTGIIGSTAGSNGTAMVDGTASKWTNSGALTVGSAGTGALTISNGGVVTNTSGVIGTTATTGNGSVTVTGSGSSWTNSTGLTVGSAGTGSLAISNGGTVSNTTGIIGGAATSNGQVTVAGSGSSWTNSAVLTVGSAGAGSLAISNGGTVSNTNGIIGTNFTGSGIVTVDGANSQWANNGTLTVGSAGNGALTVSNGGQITSINSVIGNSAISGKGSVTLTGLNSKWTNTGVLTVGNAGTGSLSLTDTSTLSDTFLTIGSSATGRGTVTADFSLLNVASAITVGNSGQGSLTLQNNSEAISAGTATIGNLNGSLGLLDIESGSELVAVMGILGGSAGSQGTATVSGSNSLLFLASDLTIGKAGQGSLTIQNNGNTTVGGTTYLGYSGTGTLDIESGGTLSSNAVGIGLVAGSQGTATVSGAGSQWTTSDLTIGSGGTGSLTIQNNGSVITGGTSTTGIGYMGMGTLDIESGGTLSSYLVDMGAVTGGRGVATVNGPGSSWIVNSGQFNIGDSGHGLMFISDGGTVNASGAAIEVGVSSNSLGYIDLTDTGSSLTSNSLNIAISGQGILDVDNGSTATTSQFSLATNTGSIGYLEVLGPGSNLSTNGFVGGAGTATISIYSGGALTASSSQLSVGSGGTTSATIDGSGSSFNSNDLTLASAGGNTTVTLSNDGNLTVPHGIILADGTGSSGTLNIGSAPGFSMAAPGTVNTPSINFGAGTGVINFNHTSSNYVFSPALIGYGTINAYAGTTELTGDLTGFTGVTNLLGGNLLYSFNSGSTINTALTGAGNVAINSGGITFLASDSSGFTGTTTIADSSTLSVNGQLGGTVNVADGGTLKGHGMAGDVIAASGSILAPGNSIGTLTVGSLLTSPGTTYQVEVNASGGHDLIHSTGTALLNGGTVAVNYAPGTYTPGTSYTILTADGGVTGAFDPTTTIFGTSLFLNSALSYDANDVFLNITQTNPFPSVGQTRNQINTARAVQSLGGSSPVYEAVSVLTSAPDARATFDNLSGAFHASTQTALLNEQHLISDALLSRMDTIADDHPVTKPFHVASQNQDLTGMIPAASGTSGIWMQSFGDWSQFNGNGNAGGIRNQNAGTLIGADGMLSDHWHAGGAVGYSHSYLTGDKAHADSDNYHAALYAQRKLPQGTDIRFGGDYTWHALDNKRTVNFTGYSAESEKADSNARSGQLFVDISQPISLKFAGDATLAPYGTIAYLHQTSDSYTEQGGPAALAVGGDSMDVLSTTLGARVHKSVALPPANTIKHVNVDGSMGWQHLSGALTPSTSMQFASGGDGFTVGGTPLARDALVYNANIGVNLTKDASVALTYQGQLSHQTQEQTLGGKFTYKF